MKAREATKRSKQIVEAPKLKNEVFGEDDLIVADLEIDAPTAVHPIVIGVETSHVKAKIQEDISVNTEMKNSPSVFYLFSLEDKVLMLRSLLSKSRF